MSKPQKYIPKHRTPPKHAAPTKVLRNTLLLTSVAAAATGVAVSGGVLSGTDAKTVSAATSLDVAARVPTLSAAQIAARQDSESSRDDRRQELDPAKKAALSTDTGDAVTITEDVTDDDPRSIAQALLAEFGFSQDQFGCLDSLWTRESNWRVNADNPSSSAYGIPQALPGSKMSSAGADWATNPATQIRWGLGYIQDRYGSPCGAWSHSESNGWY
ncbi:lytic transglycosylase domain-containing protein [Nocardioides sp.]|uniref:aggregation-promoting factor C-terminal-like domain-containing protein n=1 Tax=Nocardioides sp. TaxID=35761 RepID=UPI003D10D6F6